jgi:hypothetical protein
MTLVRVIMHNAQVCEDCPNVKLGREQESMTVHVEPGMVNGQVGKGLLGIGLAVEGNAVASAIWGMLL